MQAPPVKDGPRINDEIRVPKVLLIDQHGKIVWRADGSEWEPKDFVARMRRP